VSDSLNFKYTLTEQHYVRAMRAFMRLQIWRFILIVLGIVVAMPLVMALAGFVSLGASWLAPIMGMCAGVAAVVWLQWVWRPKYLARNSPFVGIEYEMTFSPDGVSSRSSNGNANTQWSVYTVAHETFEYFLLCSGKNLFYPFPKQAFADPKDVDRFRDLVRAHVPNAKLLDRPKK
jgi:hypothetical protein